MPLGNLTSLLHRLFARVVHRSLRLPLRDKVRLVIVMVASIALLAVVGAVFGLQLQIFRTTFVSDLNALASIMASNTSAALDFDDPKAAVETLSALRAKPSIISTTIVRADGDRFASFGSEETPEGLAEFSRGSETSAAGQQFLHTEPILRDGKQLGLLYVRADYAMRRRELIRGSLGIMAAVLTGSIFLILLLTARLHFFVTRPIAQLADAARDVARRNDYSIRVTKVVEDELGQLTDAFNQMLGEIQRQDSALQAARGSLEDQVDALAVSEARFRGVVENLGEALLFVGLNGETLFINPRFTMLLGWQEQDLAGVDALKLLIPDADRYRLLLATEMAEQDRNAFEVQLLHRDGRRIWTEIHASSMRGPGGELIGSLAAILDITVRRRTADDLEALNKQLIDTSRAAGMAEVATGVLHNVGNVLNSVNVTAALALQKLRASKVPNFSKAAALMVSKNGTLAEWLTTDPQGQRLPGYLAKLSDYLAVENTELIRDLDHLATNVEHIKEIVSVQQSYACVNGVIETLEVEQLVEDALRMNTAKFTRHGIDIIRKFAAAPAVAVDRHKVLQIIVNLVGNAKHALEETDQAHKQITIGIAEGESGFVEVKFVDNGIGIASENLTRIFQHGFTTKKSGHGFGLHSGALAAREIGGSLTAHSDGPGHGATFILSLPIAVPLHAA